MRLDILPSRLGTEHLEVAVRCKRQAIERALRDRLIVSTRVDLVPFGRLPRTDYTARLVDYGEAET